VSEQELDQLFEIKCKKCGSDKAEIEYNKFDICVKCPECESSYEITEFGP